MRRRTFVSLIGLAGVGYVASRYWPDQGILNPCLNKPLPQALSEHEVVQSAFQDVDSTMLWDAHVHLVGTGDSGQGPWIDPQMTQWYHPLKFAQRIFYLNASCVSHSERVDKDYVDRLRQLHLDMPKGAKLMLLAFDHHYSKDGVKDLQHSPFYIPNQYVADIASAFPDAFEWIASVHPYRKDAIAELDNAVANGARAIKWLPPAQGIDPLSPKCDEFYEQLVKLKLPLLTHAGDELAVEGREYQVLGNPLRLRRPLDHGVKVVVAHCASLGTNVDLDKGSHGPVMPNFELFKRLMDENDYQGKVFGEISALTQINRFEEHLSQLLSRPDWHPRLVNGSDYPLPGVMPLISVSQFVESGYLPASVAPVVSEVRQYNPVLFDFVLKRHLRFNGQQFSPTVFESKRIYAAGS